MENRTRGGRDDPRKIKFGSTWKLFLRQTLNAVRTTTSALFRKEWQKFLRDIHVQEEPVKKEVTEKKEILLQLTLLPNKRSGTTKRLAACLELAVLLIGASYTLPIITLPRQHVTTEITTLVSPYVLPPADTQAGGGGGGGDRDKLQASKGTLPKFSREQITPPVVVLRNPDPKLAVEPTVVVPPEIVMAQSPQLGDPLQDALGQASNGTGSGGGIGSGSGGGVGSGHGPGVGPGWGGGIGGGAYRVGGGVSAPRAIYQPDPEYSEEARKAKYQGVVVLRVVIGPDGRAHEISVQRSLGLGLDEQAIKAVREWKFEPARKDGKPVAVQVNVEVNFRLY